MAFIIVSLAFILFTTVGLQGLVNNQFRMERFFRELQFEVESIQDPLLNYLSTRSSRSLSDLMAQEQILRNMLPEERRITSDQFDLESREIYFLLESYLDRIDGVINLKRARAMREYTASYEEMSRFSDYIVDRIDQISLYGLRSELANYEGIINASRRMLVWNLILIITAFLVAVIWISAAIGRVSEPMDRLARAAGELSFGNFDIEDIRVETIHEVELVVSAFNRMKHDIRQYIAELNRQKQIEKDYMEAKVRNLKMEQLLKRTELYTMQAQMNPHFLFNTLNTGVQLAIMERADRTADFMDHLAQFYRYTSRERDLMVSLRHEIEGLEAYLYILRIRFAKSLDFKTDIPEILLDKYEVPSLILQPLVENSVIHAFKGIKRKGIIEIRVWEDYPILFLLVKDNGVGMDRGTAERLLKHHSGDTEWTSKVMGLENVIQRLYYCFPTLEDVITISGNPNEGTEIQIRIDTRVTACIPS